MGSNINASCKSFIALTYWWTWFDMVIWVLESKIQSCFKWRMLNVCETLVTEGWILSRNQYALFPLFSEDAQVYVQFPVTYGHRALNFMIIPLTDNEKDHSCSSCAMFSLKASYHRSFLVRQNMLSWKNQPRYIMHIAMVQKLPW